MISKIGEGGNFSFIKQQKRVKPREQSTVQGKKRKEDMIIEREDVS